MFDGFGVHPSRFRWTPEWQATTVHVTNDQEKQGGPGSNAAGYAAWIRIHARHARRYPTMPRVSAYALRAAA